MDDVEGPSAVDRYPSVHRRSHQWRTRRANGIAALALIAGIVLVIAALALFA